MKNLNDKFKSLPDNADMKQIFNYIVYQKDLLNMELYEKIELLQDKIRLLKENDLMKNT